MADVPEFDVEALEDLTWRGKAEGGDLTVVTGPEMVDKTRWAVVKRLVFSYEGTFYAMTWRSPATDMQEEDFEPEVVEVFPVERVVTFYEPVP